MTNRTATATRLNRLAQLTRITTGEIDQHGPSRVVSEQRVLVGDEVVTRHNQRRLRTDRGVMVENRDHWTFTTMQPERHGPSPRTIDVKGNRSAVAMGGLGTSPADEEPGRSTARYVADDIVAATIHVLAGEQARRAGPAAMIESRRIVEACEAFAVGRRFVDLTYAQLCHVAHVSERRIRSAFQAVFGMSTMDYLRRLALTEARARLHAADPRTATVSEIAADLGFWHLSRFASRYRALFGEMPSATLSAASSAT